jgi:hypothetical protein
MLGDSFGPNYFKFWTYSTRKAFIEARPWLLAVVSASLLKPPVER